MDLLPINGVFPGIGWTLKKRLGWLKRGCLRLFSSLPFKLAELWRRFSPPAKNPELAIQKGDTHIEGSLG